MVHSFQNIAENPANNQKHLLRWFLFFLVNTEEALSITERDAMLCTFNDLSGVIEAAEKEVSHV